MRLDKWLKVTGLIPRRTVANEACDAGRVRRNGRVAQASDNVVPGDTIEFDLGRAHARVEVLDVPAGGLPKARQGEAYRRLDEPGEAAERERKER